MPREIRWRTLEFRGRVGFEPTASDLGDGLACGLAIVSALGRGYQVSLPPQKCPMGRASTGACFDKAQTHRLIYLAGACDFSTPPSDAESCADVGIPSRERPRAKGASAGPFPEVSRVGLLDSQMLIS